MDTTKTTGIITINSLTETVYANEGDEILVIITDIEWALPTNAEPTISFTSIL